MAPGDDRIDRLRDDLHSVDTRLVRVETELKLHREQSAQQHDDVLRAIADLRRDVTPPGPPPSLPPGPAPATLPPPDHEPSSDPGAITVSPRKLAPWIGLLARLLVAAGLGGATVHGCEHLPEPAEASP
jgi:hypothetical protein